MEAGKATIQESVAHARELEVIHEDHKKGSTVGNIGADGLNNLDEEEKATVDAIRLQRGRPPMNRTPQQPQPPQPPGTTRPPSTTGRPPFTGQCRFCKIMGHHQKDCRKRKAAGVSCVDAAGKPYANQLAPVQQQPESNAGTASITAVPNDPYHLKW